MEFVARSPRILQKIRLNLDPEERMAIKDLQELSRERIIVVEPTDKTGGLAILPFEGYNTEMKKMLSETYWEEGVEKQKYPKSTKEKLKKDYRDIVELVWDRNREGFIGDKDAEAAIPEREIPGRVYGLPKDHKEVVPDTGIPPLRPVISCSSTIMEGPGKIVDK